MAANWVCARCIKDLGRTVLRVRSAAEIRTGASSRAVVNFGRPQSASPLHFGRQQSLTCSQYRQFSSASPFQQSGTTKNVEDSSAIDASTKAKSGKRKAARNKTTTSLRRVAVEAQRSRDGLVRGSGRRRFIDPEANTKEITASCAAEQYNLSVAKHLLRQEGYEIDPLHTGLYPQVIHIQTPIYPTRDAETGEERNVGPGDVFVFPSGSVVSWNVPEKVQKRLVHRVLLPAAIRSHLETIELEDMDYLEDPDRSSSEVIGDAIVLGTQRRSLGEINDVDTASTDLDADLILAKIAFSSGIARSTKLAVLENLLSSYFETTKSIPTILSRGSKLRFTRSFILRKTGELLSIRAQLNLYSELTDTMPDLFWDSPSQLGLSDYYDEVGRALDVNARIRTLNEKMDYASEIASVLRERLSEKHSTGLEWLIIFLISVEVGFELHRLWQAHGIATDEDSTEAMMRQWLARQLGKDLDS
ncbi:YagE family protein [Myriangium duriaei CBS 260.36]|uniref:YagE family protein n=1 Tax=Myriangium duriaei CBS 260.36 TaxID=1168546 RepID=A0A9P4IWA7_9PEZI|nr:YagE family protein [Myriangium duriaei CBS 260.36]